jgi:hypothetical protein
MIPVAIPQDYPQNIALVSQYFCDVRNGTLPQAAMIELAYDAAWRTMNLRFTTLVIAPPVGLGWLEFRLGSDRTQRPG